MKSIKVKSVGTLDESDKLLLEEAEGAIVSSIDAARDFCKTLIGFSSGSIPVYFGILKYLGLEQIDTNSLQSRISILPPVLFLGCIVLLTIALVPRRFSVRPTVILYDYRRVRKSIIGVLRRGIIYGSATYIAGLSLAIFIFLELLF